MIAWLDIETTGLVAKEGRILEVGIILTDDQLQEVAHRSAVVRFTALERYSTPVDDYVQNMHTSNGLWVECESSVFSAWDVETSMLDLLARLDEKPVMGGNSITLDRTFLSWHMPRLLDAFHYRSIDVTSVRELANRWRPGLMEFAPSGKTGHRVLDDLRDSIGLCRFFKHQLFNNPTIDEGAHQ